MRFWSLRTMTTTGRTSGTVKNELNTCVWSGVDIDDGSRRIKSRHRKKEMSEAKAKTKYIDRQTHWADNHWSIIITITYNIP